MTMQMSAGRDTGTGKKRTEKTGNFRAKRRVKRENYQLRDDANIFQCVRTHKKVCQMRNSTNKKATQITLRSVPWGTDQSVH